MTQYPDTLPDPTVSGFSAVVAMGVIRSDMETHQAQRRVFTTMPHSFTISFTLTLAQWARWHLWMLENGYRWFDIRLPSLYAGQLLESTSLMKIRLTSSFSASMLAADVVQVSVTAESAPSMIDDYFEALA